MRQGWLLSSIVFLTSTCSSTWAMDWPMYRADPARSGVSRESLEATALEEAWTWQSSQPPAPAWPGPAKWDAYAQVKDLKSMRNYDPVFHPIVVDGAVYFGSSADDSIHKLSLSNGKAEWRFTTDGPIRVAPTYASGKLYFGSDDGHAYCIDAINGDLIWKFSPSLHEAKREGKTPARRVLNNQRLISFWPVRTGVVIVDDTAYFGASMLPWKDSMLCAVDADTGRPDGPHRWIQHLGLESSLEGAMLASASTLVVPQGRVPPMLFDRMTGKRLGALSGGGGSFVLLTDDDRILHGPGNKKGWITDSSTQTRAKIASYDRGNQVLVDEDSVVMLRDTTLGTMSRSRQELLWVEDCTHPYAMIKAGRYIIAGGYDEIGAYDAHNGHLAWSGKVSGRAYGLAVASERLLVSTDRGTIHCFQPGKSATTPAPESSTRQQSPFENLGDAPAIEKVEHPALLDRWVFQSDTLVGGAGSRRYGAKVRNLAGGADALIMGQTLIERAGKVQALAMDGETSGVQVAEDFKQVDRPEEAMTATAWARVDQGQEWGGIVSMTQDNGSYERGWILGYRKDRPGFAVKGAGGDNGLTWVVSPQGLRGGEWHHVAGTYDGRTIKLYVDGKLVASSDKQSGPIDYPDHAFYHIGAYRDDDEHFRMKGLLHEVRLYDVALDDETLAVHYDARKALFPPPVTLKDEHQEDSGLTPLSGPALHFADPSTAVVVWQTDEPTPTRLAFWYDEDPRLLGDGRERLEHRVSIPGLRQEVEYRYALKLKKADSLEDSKKYLCDTSFNYCVPPLEARLDGLCTDRDRRNAAKMIEQLPSKRGVCLVLGVTDGELSAAVATKSDMKVIAFDTDPERVERLRAKWLDAGVYGNRMAVYAVDSMSELRIPLHFANLVVSERGLAGESIAGLDEIALSLIQPHHGIAMLPKEGGVRMARKPAFEGAADWSHMYGTPDNSAFAGETLAESRFTTDLEVQWVGRPGPRYQSDRGNRKPAPLSTQGRLFMQGLQRVIAVDAYNGTILWSLEIPDLLRFNIPRDTGNWCADEEHVFLAVGQECWRVNAATGKIVSQHVVKPGTKSDWQWDWGYVAREGDLLFGSAVKKGSSYIAWWGPDKWYDGKDPSATSKICSDRIFAMENEDPHRVVWSYEDGVILNPTITLKDETLYFVETRHPTVKAAPSRRVSMKEMWLDTFMVALDATSGRLLWEKPYEGLEGDITFYLAAGDENLITVVSREGEFEVAAFSPQDGSPVWSRRDKWEVDHHGKHLSRPAIVQGDIVVRPYTFREKDGAQVDRKFPGGHQCGTYTCSTNALFLRAGQLTMWDRTDGGGTRWNRVRPDCWISTIPAQGMVLSPEGGGGCSCGSWMETSMALIPVIHER